MKVGCALNPMSGKGRSDGYRSILREVLDKYPVEMQWLPVGTRDEAYQAMHDATHSGAIDALIIVGGDGFIHNAVNAVGDSGVPLGIVAAGSGNDIAREFGLPIHCVHDSIHQIAASLLTRHYRDVDVMEITWEGGCERALAIVSVGIDANVNLRTNKMTWPKGNLRYARALPGTILDYEPFGLRLTMDGHVHEGTMSLLSVANTRFFGGGFCISPDALPDDGLLDVVLTPGLRLAEFGSLVPKLLLYRHLKDPRVHLYRTTQVRIEQAACGAALPTIMADGEEICQAPATITLLAKALRLVM
ncbi:diacylglycerol kinase family protein [Trueperella pyogenes]|uniref:diacylglycerol/lipid kinase family protein n=1 Tax=Trueperella pyogenes TaxID=1661 RepID=UPI000581CACE|nr:diacylglycerol kinase family protein [Trueperella pyogenes]AJC69617.1 diacylglycerol kinase [Trueperella pyogenes TP8]AZR00408.1 diacylglycerol kinase family lipid kinase [Trueperella pyogenes]MBB3024657.1 diacylglycerol kinase (ATP) [Trueperella pyogenes]UVJ58672.1 hypothetical protein M1F28_04710 [Trueperella pyogenes]WHU56722.1 diacylglycerol kinase family protein [Trueperella pyogenes]